MVNAYACLAVAIVAELIGSSFLKLSDGCTRPIPTLITACGYSVAFYFFSLAVRTIPVGIAYAVWSGVGIVAISVIGRVIFGQKLDAAATVGLGLILAGVLVVHLFSKSFQ